MPENLFALNSEKNVKKSNPNKNYQLFYIKLYIKTKTFQTIIDNRLYGVIWSRGIMQQKCKVFFCPIEIRYMEVRLYIRRLYTLYLKQNI